MKDTNAPSSKMIDENYARIVFDQMRAISFLSYTSKEAFLHNIHVD